MALACAGATPPPDPNIAPMPVSFSPRPGDLVRVRVFRETDLTADYPVDEDGKVLIPGLGDVPVAGQPRAQLIEQLVKAYGSSIKDPAIAVTFLRRVAIGGGVRTPGLYPAEATTTVGDLVAVAGGVQPDGRLDVIQLRRDGRIIHVNVPPTLFIGQIDLRPGDQIFVPYKRWTQYGTLIGLQIFSIIVFATLSVIQLTK